MSFEGLAYFHWAWSVQTSSMLYHVPRLHFLSWPNNIPWSAWTVLCLSVHPVMDIWVASTLASLNHAAVSTLGSVLLGICVCICMRVCRSGLAGPCGGPVFNIWKTTKLVSTMAAPFYIPSNNTQGFQFLHIFASSCYPPPTFFFSSILINLFVWLLQVLVASLRIFHLSCSMPTMSCGMRGLVPCPGLKPRPPALGARSLSCWTTREGPLFSLFLL